MGCKARGAGCWAAPVRAFLAIKEEGLQVAAAGGDWGTVEILRTEVQCSKSITLPLKHHSSFQLERSALEMALFHPPREGKSGQLCCVVTGAVQLKMLINAAFENVPVSGLRGESPCCLCSVSRLSTC